MLTLPPESLSLTVKFGDMQYRLDTCHDLWSLLLPPEDLKHFQWSYSYMPQTHSQTLFCDTVLCPVPADLDAGVWRQTPTPSSAKVEEK